MAQNSDALAAFIREAIGGSFITGGIGSGKTSSPALRAPSGPSGRFLRRKRRAALRGCGLKPRELAEPDTSSPNQPEQSHVPEL